MGIQPLHRGLAGGVSGVSGVSREQEMRKIKNRKNLNECGLSRTGHSKNDQSGRHWKKSEKDEEKEKERQGAQSRPLYWQSVVGKLDKHAFHMKIFY